MRVFAVAVTTLVVLVSDSSIAQRLSQEPRFERYRSAAVDANGDLTIVTMDGRTGAMYLPAVLRRSSDRLDANQTK